MICLLDLEKTPDVGIITRIRRARKGYKGIQSRQMTILGLKTLYITVHKTPAISKKTLQKRLAYAAEKMKAAYINKVLFARDFTYREHILREGFEEIDESLLMEALAGKIASVFSGKEKVGAFFAERLTRGAEQSFCDMCRDYRYVIAVIESDAGQLFSSLGRRLGISVIGQPTDTQLLRADTAVFYNPPKQKTVLSESCIAVPVRPAALNGVICNHYISGITVRLKNNIEPEIPQGFAHEPLFAYALYAGTLCREDVVLRDVVIDSPGAGEAGYQASAPDITR